MAQPIGPWSRTWGEATAFLARKRRFGFADLMVVVGLLGIVLALLGIGEEWTNPPRRAVEIDLSPLALPRYTMFSLSRGLFAYVLSLCFTLTYGYWAARDRLAEKVLIPLLDVLQSIPVLGFMPGLVIALVALFPRSNTGLELAAVIMIFTGQVWNMTFSYYHSLKTIPLDLREASTVYRLGQWQQLKWVELPYSVFGLVWNSMMSMAGGWFFLMINEAFVLGDRDFRLPGLGSYMSVAVARGDVAAMVWAVLAMTAMIVLVDQLLWRPVVVWAERFRVEEQARGPRATSWFLSWLQLSGLLRWIGRRFARLSRPTTRKAALLVRRLPRIGLPGTGLSRLAFLVLLGALLFGGWRLAWLLVDVEPREWARIAVATAMTLGRVLAAMLLGTLWALPAGLAIGLSPRLSRVFQPIVQVVASFPAPMLFPAVIALLAALRVSLNFGSVLLMLLGTQWYILFNVIAGAMAVPADLREAAASFRFDRWHRARVLYFPAVLPHLITGWVTAAGGAWNASIVAEYVTFRGETFAAWGIGAQIGQAAAAGDLPVLGASVGVLALTVVTFNRLVWKPLHRLASERFGLST